MRAWTVAAIVASTLAAQGTDSRRFRIDPDAYLAHIRFLASDDLAGRGNGTVGIARAAAYLSAEFKKSRLDPGGDAGTYLQAFDLIGRDDLAATLTVSSRTGDLPFRLGSHFYPLSASEDRDSRRSSSPPLPIIFAGYGIFAPGLGYDDFRGVTVNGAAVAVFTHEPQENDPQSVFEGTSLTPFSTISSKAEEAGRRGARLLIVIEDPVHLTDRARTTSWFEDPQIGDYPIPVVRMDRVRLSRALGGLDFERIARTIDDTLVSRSQLIAGATIVLPAGLKAANPHGANVVGILKGATSFSLAEAIVVGGHYDHLGVTSRSSRDGAEGQIHNGADDNASGTALVLEMARAASRQQTRFKRTVIFALFAGEEVGLLGSRFYVQHAPVAMRRTIAMVNLDMVGRANGRVMVGGALAHSARLRSLKTSSSIRFDDFSEGYGDDSSDNDPFEHEHVPTLLFFTGFHEDYHKVSDDWERIDARGAAEIGRIAMEMVAELADR
jgi:peptidase M28-like protein